MPRIPIIILAFCLLISAVHGQHVVPSAAENTPGNNGEQTSFFFRSGVQKIFDASAFSGPVQINGFSVRAMPGSSYTGSTGLGLNLIILMSTSPSAVDGLNTADPFLNHGADLTEVKNSPLNLTAPGTIGPDGTTPWSNLIAFDNPFIYNPAFGNLIFEMGGNSPVTLPGQFFDAWEFNNDEVSRLFITQFGPEAFTDSLGVIVNFDTTPIDSGIPEPATAGLLGLAGLALLRRRRI